jgi:hypothetical protein
LDGAGVCIALVAPNISSTAEFLDRNGVAPIKPDAITTKTSYGASGAQA